jgi:hypothetical protein
LGACLIFLGGASIVLGVVIAYLTDWKTGIPSFYQLAGAGITMVLTGAAMMLWPGRQRERVNAWADELRHVYDEECERDLSQLRGEHHNLSVGLIRWPIGVNPPAPVEELYDPPSVARYITGRMSGHVFLTGDRGSGKTVLLRQVQKEILRDPSCGHLVPALLRMADWQEGQGLEDWIADIARRMLPNPPERVLRQLLRERRIVLLFDGLDEIADEEDRLNRATNAMSKLKSSTHSMLITCRSELARQLATRNQIASDVLMLITSPIDIDEMVRQVSRSCTSESIADHLEDAVRSNPTGALANRLSVPLFLRVIGDMDIDDSEAIELERFAQAPAWDSDLSRVESHLFRVWIAQASLRPPMPSRSRSRTRIKTYTADSIERWSQSIARYLDDFGGSRVGGDLLPHTLIFPHYLWLLAGAKQVRGAVLLLTLLLWTPLLICFGICSSAKFGRPADDPDCCILAGTWRRAFTRHGARGYSSSLYPDSAPDNSGWTSGVRIAEIGPRCARCFNAGSSYELSRGSVGSRCLCDGFFHRLWSWPRNCSSSGY